MPGSRQRHVEQAQVFAVPGLVGSAQLVGGRVQVQAACAVLVRQAHERGSRLVDTPKTAGKRQEHQRVFEPLGLVDRHHLDQIGVALEAHDLLVAGGRICVDLAGQPADHRLLAVELRAGGLQQFRKVQEVGQPALSVDMAVAVGRHRQPAAGQVEQVQCLAQHGQHALAAPCGVQHAKLLTARIEGLVVSGQHGQLLDRQTHGSGRQRCACQAHILRRGHGAQPVQQVARLGAVEHRILVGQVHRSHIAAAQLASHRCRLLAGAHQHGDVGRAQATEASLRIIEPRARVVEQHGDVLGAALGKLPKAGLNIVQTGVQRQRQGRTHSRRGDKRFAPPLGVDRLERQRVAGTLPGVGPEHEGALAVPHFGLLKQVVHGRHQRHRRAVVGAQHVVAPLGGPPGRQVTVDVCPPKAVDGLLGVADQQQGAGGLVGLNAVQAVENARLHRRCVLEFVDQRHRVLGQHAGTQALGVDTVEVGVECVVEPGQHVRKAKGSGLTLEVTHPLGDAGSSVQAQAGGQGRQVFQRIHQLLEGREVRRQVDGLAGLHGFVHAERRQTGGTLFHVGAGDLRIAGPLR